MVFFCLKTRKLLYFLLENQCFSGFGLQQLAGLNSWFGKRNNGHGNKTDLIGVVESKAGLLMPKSIKPALLKI